MSKQVADVVIHASDSQDDFHDDNLDISVDYIDDGLYLGNLACARDYETLKRLEITHVLTVDVVPLPRSILDRGHFDFRFVKLADVPKEDLISQLPETNKYIKQAIDSDGTVLVHCYFGVSRSAAVVIAYIMEKYGFCFDDAFSLVKSKRRFIGPNLGFIAQLKLFGHMGYVINKEDPRFKQFRLKMAGQKLKQVKILPQSFSELVRADPGVARERPAARALRCRRCRRVLAARHNLLPHVPRDVRLDRARKATRRLHGTEPGGRRYLRGGLGGAAVPRDVVRGAAAVDGRRQLAPRRQAALPQVPEQDRQLQLAYGMQVSVRSEGGAGVLLGAQQGGVDQHRAERAAHRLNSLHTCTLERTSYIVSL